MTHIRRTIRPQTCAPTGARQRQCRARAWWLPPTDEQPTPVMQNWAQKYRLRAPRRPRPQSVAYQVQLHRSQSRLRRRPPKLVAYTYRARSLVGAPRRSEPRAMGATPRAGNSCVAGATFRPTRPATRKNREDAMPHFMIRWQFTDTSAKALVSKPHDRTGAATALIEGFGGKLHSYYIAFGTCRTTGSPSANSPTTRTSPRARCRRLPPARMPVSRRRRC